jgi:hypothetical protein
MRFYLGASKTFTLNLSVINELCDLFLALFAFDVDGNLIQCTSEKQEKNRPCAVFQGEAKNASCTQVCSIFCSQHQESVGEGKS